MRGRRGHKKSEFLLQPRDVSVSQVLRAFHIVYVVQQYNSCMILYDIVISYYDTCTDIKLEKAPRHGEAIDKRVAHVSRQPPSCQAWDRYKYNSSIIVSIVVSIMARGHECAPNIATHLITHEKTLLLCTTQSQVLVAPAENYSPPAKRRKKCKERAGTPINVHRVTPTCAVCSCEKIRGLLALRLYCLSIHSTVQYSTVSSIYIVSI